MSLADVMMTSEQDLFDQREALRKAYVEAVKDERRAGKAYVNATITAAFVLELEDRLDAELTAAKARTASLAEELAQLDGRIRRAFFAAPAGEEAS